MAMSIKVCKRFVTVTTLKYFNVRRSFKDYICDNIDDETYPPVP
jgi:hypothetical protein